MEWSTELILSNLDTDKAVRVDADVSLILSNHHVHGIRFLYQCFRLHKKGSILNHDEGMNFQLQVSAFLNAISNYITTKHPVLIICPEGLIQKWQFHLEKHAKLAALTLSEQNCDEVLKMKSKIILSDVKNTKLLREIKHFEYFYIFVDELDKVITQNSIKGYSSEFKIGLTHRNFLKDPDVKLQWSILKWCNVENLGKLIDFTLLYESYLKSLKIPYEEIWHRLTWKYCTSFKQSAETHNDVSLPQANLKKNTSQGQKRQSPRASTKRNPSSKKSRPHSEESISSSPVEEMVEELAFNRIAVEEKVEEIPVNRVTDNIEREIGDCDSLSMLYGASETDRRSITLPILSEANLPNNKISTAKDDDALSLLFGD